MTKYFLFFKPQKIEVTENSIKFWEGFKHFKEGLEYFKERKDLDALKCFDTAIDLGFNADEIYETRGLVLQSLSFDLDAIDDFDKQLSITNKRANSYFGRGLSKQTVGDYYGAKKDFEEAVWFAKQDSDETAIQAYTFQLKMHNLREKEFMEGRNKKNTKRRPKSS